MKAYEFLQNNQWTQWASAKKNNGKMCASFDDEAVCFCAAGVISRIYGGHAFEAYEKISHVSDLSSRKDVIMFNDNPKTTKEAVLELFKKAAI